MKDGIGSGNTVKAVSLCLAMSFTPATIADETLDGAALYLKYNCHICHGDRGAGGVRDGYPMIAGQDRRYLIQQTLDIRDGARENGQTKLMRPLVKYLGDPEIEAIATYLSARP